MKIESFKDLIVWQEAKALVLIVYKLTKTFPRDELFGISNQMRRAGVSITSNVAEGFVRRGIKEKSQFYYMAIGSLAELQSQLEISYEMAYISKKEFNTIEENCRTVGRLLTGLIKSTSRR